MTEPSYGPDGSTSKTGEGWDPSQDCNSRNASLPVNYDLGSQSGEGVAEDCFLFALLRLSRRRLSNVYGWICGVTQWFEVWWLSSLDNFTPKAHVALILACLGGVRGPDSAGPDPSDRGTERQEFPLRWRPGRGRLDNEQARNCLKHAIDPRWPRKTATLRT